MIDKVIALLPMKGNSERVPNKNLKIFDGKPLYHRVLNTLLQSKYIDKVVINTDSEILKTDIETFFKERVIIIDRPNLIIGDFVSMNKIIQYDIEKIEGDLYIQTHSTNPLLKTASIDKAIEKMIVPAIEREYDSVFSVTKVQTRLYKKNGDPFNHDSKELLRTQDLEPLYEENSNFFIFTKESFIESGGKRIGKEPLMFELDKIEAIDIDEPQDFIMAEALYKLLR